MFNRQWFGPASQIGLETSSLAFENYLKSKDYSSAIELALSFLNKTTDYKHYWKRQVQRALHLQQRSSISNLRIKFINFWNGFNPHNNEILNFIKYFGSLHNLKCEVVTSGRCDIEFYSCFDNSSSYSEPYQGATRILYLGENVMPSFTNYDYSLSFEMSDLCHRNIFLPLWLLRSEIFAVYDSDYIPYKIEKFFQPRERINNNGKIVYLGNNLTPFR